MRTYLSRVNPVVSVVVLLLCLWAGAFDKGDFEPDQLVEGGFATYFVAKGLFCGSALFLLGRILLAFGFRTQEAG